MLWTLFADVLGADIFELFEFTPDIEGSPEATKGGLTDIAADEASEETWDREEGVEE